VLKNALPVAQPLFGSTFLGHVPKHEHDPAHFTVFVSNGRAAIGDRQASAVLRDQNRVVGQAHHRAFPKYPCHGALHDGARVLIFDPEHLVQRPPLAPLE
jgi:hypothetical protein